jgi:hypothetical protein
MMEAIRSSERSVYTISTLRHNPEDGILHTYRSDNLKSYVNFEYQEWDGDNIMIILERQVVSMEVGFN